MFFFLSFLGSLYILYVHNHDPSNGRLVIAKIERIEQLQQFLQVVIWVCLETDSIPYIPKLEPLSREKVGSQMLPAIIAAQAASNETHDFKRKLINHWCFFHVVSPHLHGFSLG